MISNKFKIDDAASEMKLLSFIDDLLGVEKFSPDPERLTKWFSHFKEEFNRLNIPSIIVAGTNGKGEVSLILERYALENNLYVHLWNSPHIISVRERFSHNGNAISAIELLDYFEKSKNLTKKLSYYEFLFFVFCQSSLDKIQANPNQQHILIFEVGLGGRLDATNFFDSELAILTSISRDHTEFLGNRLADILNEKIQVTRSNGYLVCGVEQPMLKTKIKSYVGERDISLKDVTDHLREGETFKNLNFHKKNQLMAKEAFHIFWKHILKRNDAVKTSFKETVWGRPLRMTYKGCQFILLGSHNLDGIRHLAKWTNELNQKITDSSNDSKTSHHCSHDSSNFYFDEAWLSFSRQNEDDLRDCLDLIFKSPCLGREVSLTSFNHPRATKWESLMDCAKSLRGENNKKVTFEENFNHLLGKLEKKRDRKVLLAGSYYFLGSFISSLPTDSYQFE